MKKYILALAAMICFDYGHSFAQTSAKAAEHMGLISNQMNLLMQDTWAYTSTLAHSKGAKKIDSKRKELLKTSLSAQKNIAKLPSYYGDASLRDSTLAYLKIHYLILNENYEKIVDMEAIAEESYDRMEAYLTAQEQANVKLDEAGDRMSEAQAKFAEKNGVRLIIEQDKTAKKLGKASSVMSYYNKYYLVFFKVYKQELYMLDALNKGDISSFEQSRNALISVANEALSKVDTMKNFKTDVSVRVACRKALNFYLDEAQNKAAGLTDFTLKNEIFGKIKKEFDAKPQANRTKEDVDSFNKAVNEMNAAANAYNKTNNSLNKERSEMLDHWSKTAQEFMARHTPKR